MAIDKLRTVFSTGAWLNNVKVYFTKINEIVNYINNSVVKIKTYNVTGDLFAIVSSNLTSLSNWTINSANGSTVALSNGKIRFTRADGALGFGDNAVYDGFGDINSKYYTFSMDFEIKRLDATSYGFGFGFKADTINSTNDYVRARLECDSGVNKGTLVMEVNGNQYSSTTKLTFALNDKVKVTMVRNGHLFTAVAQNITSINTVTPVAFVSTIVSRYTSTNWDPAMVRPYIFSLGGTYDVTEWTLSTKQPIKANIAVGDSITHGMFIDSNSKAWPELVEEITGLKFDNFGSSSTVTTDWLNGTNEIIARQPSCVYFLLGRNDITTGISQSTTLSNYSTIISRLISANIDYRIISLLPTGSANNTAMVALNTALQSRYPSKFINIESYFNDGSGNMLSKYNSGDGAHMWEAGHQEFAKRLIAADPRLQVN